MTIVMPAQKANFPGRVRAVAKAQKDALFITEQGVGNWIIKQQVFIHLF